jgi:hypothetical protein
MTAITITAKIRIPKNAIPLVSPDGPAAGMGVLAVAVGGTSWTRGMGRLEAALMNTNAPNRKTKAREYSLGFMGISP